MPKAAFIHRASYYAAMSASGRFSVGKLEHPRCSAGWCGFSGLIVLPLAALITACWIVGAAVLSKNGPGFWAPLLLSNGFGVIFMEPWKIAAWQELGMFAIMLVMLALWVAAGRSLAHDRGLHGLPWRAFRAQHLARTTAGEWRKTDPAWPVRGIPDVLYVDHGSDFTSLHLEPSAGDLRTLLQQLLIEVAPSITPMFITMMPIQPCRGEIHKFCIRPVVYQLVGTAFASMPISPITIT